MTQPKIVVEFKDVNKHFNALHVLADINLQVRQGEVIAVIGPSGSGKSTLVRCINRLETIDSGELWIDGGPLQDDGKGLYQLRTRIGMVFQQFNLYPHKTVLENICLAPIKVKGLPRPLAEQQAHELLKRVGIGEKHNAYPSALSGGQQQRVAIARALAMQPGILLFDEPTSALDPEMVGEVLEVIRELADTGITLIIVTHEMGFARQVADRVLFMDAGRIVEQGEPQTFFARPRHPRAQEFLARVIRHY
ncbi:amino acid ABC transporter ATP-binding protein [Sodalis sp. RH21]|uniref:amino acid ABC transporter ATP-binding protein n=1 Tax=unclassified Sodalis (in: enterobacteria) TaxID=2636512 RepID=UPI0039B3C504